MGKPAAWPLVAALLGATGGCFYVDGINQRPAAQIRQDDPGAPIYRNDPVALVGVAADPDGDALRYEWRAFACGDAPRDESGCDDEPYASSTTSTFDFAAAADRAGGDTAKNLFITFDVFDASGAPASPQARLDLVVLDREPRIVIRKASRYAVNSIPVEGTPIQLFATVSDGDNAPAELKVDWEIFGPGGATWELVDAAPPTTPVDEITVQYNKVLTPSLAGLYTVKVTVDQTPANTQDTELDIVEMLEFSVGTDSPPCIVQTLPVASPIGQALPVTQATLFRVPVVRDDLDGFPELPGDPIAGAPTFRWSLRAPGAPGYAVEPVATTNSLAFDPARYQIGDLVDVRVEIADRKATPINCPADDLFCSTISDPACVQRVTWRVEVR